VRPEIRYWRRGARLSKNPVWIRCYLISCET
jgi:hypothetical protein